MYYANSETSETTWDLPPELEEHRAVLAAFEAQQREYEQQLEAYNARAAAPAAPEAPATADPAASTQAEEEGGEAAAAQA